jgi:hypothetical protein
MSRGRSDDLKSGTNLLLVGTPRTTRFTGLVSQPSPARIHRERGAHERREPLPTPISPSWWHAMLLRGRFVLSRETASAQRDIGPGWTSRRGCIICFATTTIRYGYSRPVQREGDASVCRSVSVVCANLVPAETHDLHGVDRGLTCNQLNGIPRPWTCMRCGLPVCLCSLQHAGRFAARSERLTAWDSAIST